MYKLRQLMVHATRDVPTGGVTPKMFSNLQVSWSKVSQAAKGCGHSIFYDLLLFSNNLVAIVGQLVRTPPPSNRARFCDLLPDRVYLLAG